uniref:ubiquitin-associated and SH3 domain-containing protein B-like n=1 Tax=Styela clava TaxID=7725 RepID=UPI00193A30AD|nr:ubiquitin-associated and SH3 domain-containing protein B-like [Styela clava]
MASAVDSNALFLQQNAADTLLRDSSNLQVLLNMGFPKRRALKALVATGGAGVQVACDWIFAHVNDPTLDQDLPREYILYACPTGPLGVVLDDFWQNSLINCGRNGVHNSFPHVTLCGFFKCKDENVHKLLQALEEVAKQSTKDLKFSKVGLDYFSSSNYVGLFLEEAAADFLRKFSQEFANKAASAADTVVEPHSNKQLHLTLAYKFIPNQLQGLETLAKKLDLNKPSHWELRLYSKESRFPNCETLRVLYPFSPSSENQLQLINGDCVFLNADAQISKKCMDGYFYGTSWMTGCSGMFPATHVEKTTDTETWTTHKVVSILHHNQSLSDPRTIQRRYSRGADEFHSTGYNSSQSLLQTQIPSVPEIPPPIPPSVITNDAKAKLLSPHTNSQSPASKENHFQPSPVLPPRSPMSNHSAQVTAVNGEAPPTLPPREEVYTQVQKPKGQVSIVPKDIQMARRIYVFRHAERVDITFGKGWIQLSFDDKGNYHRKNINMPQKIPKRPGGPKDFHRDTPLTEMGLHQAFLTGQALKQIGASVSNVYVSPSLRCIETAKGILKGMELERRLPLRIELGLFEWMRWSPGGLPKFLDHSALLEYGINVDQAYKCKYLPQDMQQNEKCNEYFKRCHKLISSILKETSGDILICGHAGSLDGLSRELQGLSPRPMTDFVGIVTKIPYCGSVVLEEISSAAIWELIEPPYPSLTHAPNPRFDWKMMVN